MENANFAGWGSEPQFVSLFTGTLVLFRVILIQFIYTWSYFKIVHKFVYTSNIHLYLRPVFFSKSSSFFLFLLVQYLRSLPGRDTSCWDHNALNIAGCLWWLPEFPLWEFATGPTCRPVEKFMSRHILFNHLVSPAKLPRIFPSPFFSIQL